MKRYFAVVGVCAVMSFSSNAQEPSDAPPDLAERMRSAQDALNAGRYDEAVKAAREAVAADPVYAPAQRQLGTALLRAGRMEEGIEALRRSLQLDDTPSAVWKDYAHALWHMDRFEEAAEAMHESVERGGDDAGSLRTLGNWLWKLERRDEAIARMREARDADRSDPAIWKDIGWFLWEEGDRGEALEALKKAVQMGADGAGEIVLRLTARLAEEGAPDRAVEIFQTWPTDLKASELGLRLMERGRAKAARPFLRLAWDHDEKTSDIGLYLAYSRSLDGICGRLTEFTEPFIRDKMPGADPRELDVLLETLRLCGGHPDAPALVRRIENMVPEQPAYQKRVTDILQAVAEQKVAGGEREEALSLFRRVLERDPERLVWVTAEYLLEELKGREAAREYLEALAQRTTSPAVRDGVRGRLAEWDGDRDTAAELYRSSIARASDQPLIRRRLFDMLVERGRLEEAHREAEWFAEQIDAGQTYLRSYLAEMWDALAEREKALDVWELLHLSRPEVPYYAIETAMGHFELCRIDDARFTLEDAVAYEANALTYEMLAEIEYAAGRPARAVEWARRGIEKYDSRGLRRYHAENAEAAGLISTNTPEEAEAAMASATTYLRMDPGYVPISLLYGRGLEALNREEEAIAFHRGLVERSPVFLPSAIALRDLYSRDRQFRKARQWAENGLKLRPWDPFMINRYAQSMAESDRYRRALKALRKLADEDSGAVVPVLVYDLVTSCDYEGRISTGRIEEHIKALRSAGYRFLLPADLRGEDFDLSVMLIVIDADRDVVEALDDVLEAHDAKMIYAGRREVFMHRVPGKPSPEERVRLLSGGRWAMASSGGSDRSRVAVREDGTQGNPLTHSLPEEKESPDAYRERIDRTLSKWSATLSDASVKLLVYPGGDDGHMSLDTDESAVADLREIAGRHFDYAVIRDDNGFALPEAAPMRLLARWVPSGWSRDDLMEHLTTEHPYAGAELQLAKTLYWHRQHERAHVRFKRALEEGADPGEVYYHWGANALELGDWPSAREKFDMAQPLLGDDERLARAERRLENAYRPEIRLDGVAWKDNEERSHWEAGGAAHVYATDRIRLGGRYSGNAWERDGFGTVRGTRGLLAGRVYLYEQIWLDAEGGRLWLEDLPDRWIHDISLHVPNRWLSGFMELSAARHEIETVETIQADIFSDRYMLATYSRLWDQWDLFANGVYYRRDDKNDTAMLYGRFLRRLSEWPYAGAGYLFRFGDSDFDPEAYWAPEDLRQHQLYANVRGETHGVNLSLSGQAGYARERDTDWRFVWGARGGAAVNLAQRLKLQAEIYYFEGPVYNRITGTVSLVGKF